MTSKAYRLASYANGGAVPRAGIVVDDRIVDVAAALASPGGSVPAGYGTTVVQVLSRWEEIHPLLRQIAESSRRGAGAPQSLALADVRLAAPVLYPGTIFCAGANYRDHVVEMSRAMNLPEEPDPHSLGLKPWHFIKPSLACVRGPGDRIPLPAYSQKVDWEAEIAVVIGRPCRNVSVEDALSYVAGLSIVNDLSARDHLRRVGVAPDSPFHFDWVSQKSFDGALPFGPWIVPM